LLLLLSLLLVLLLLLMLLLLLPLLSLLLWLLLWLLLLLVLLLLILLLLVERELRLWQARGASRGRQAAGGAAGRGGSSCAGPGRGCKGLLGGLLRLIGHARLGSAASVRVCRSRRRLHGHAPA